MLILITRIDFKYLSQDPETGSPSYVAACIFTGSSTGCSMMPTAWAAAIGMEADLAERMERDLRRPHALHIKRFPDLLHVGVLVVPHSVQICRAPPGQSLAPTSASAPVPQKISPDDYQSSVSSSRGGKSIIITPRRSQEEQIDICK